MQCMLYILGPAQTHAGVKMSRGNISPTFQVDLEINIQDEYSSNGKKLGKSIIASSDEYFTWKTLLFDKTICNYKILMLQRNE